MGESKKKTDWKRVEGYSLLLALHRYAKWVSSLRSAKPSSVSAADRELRLILTLRDEHFPMISFQVDELARGHGQITQALAGRTSFQTSQFSQDGDQLGRGTRQIDVVTRLVSSMEKYLATTPPVEQEAVGAGRGLAAPGTQSSRPF